MFKHFIFAFSLIVVFWGCSESKTEPEEKQTKEVYTVNYPLYYFTKRMAPEGVEVFFPVPKELDPAFWVPSTQETLAFVKADLSAMLSAPLLVEEYPFSGVLSITSCLAASTSRSISRDDCNLKSWSLTICDTPGIVITIITQKTRRITKETDGLLVMLLTAIPVSRINDRYRIERIKFQPIIES